MAEFGIPVPDRIRSWVNKVSSNIYDTDTAKKKAHKSPIPGELLRKVDKLHFQAKKILGSFYASYSSLESQQIENQPIQGWSLIRKYATPGTGFYYGEESIAPNSVVVRKVFFTDESGSESIYKTTYHWISNRIEPVTKLPFSYTGVISETENDSFLTVISDDLSTDDPTKAKEMAAERFRANIEPDTTPNRTGCLWRYEIQVFKQGKSMGEKAKKKKATRIPVIQRESLPVPVPI